MSAVQEITKPAASRGEAVPVPVVGALSDRIGRNSPNSTQMDLEAVADAVRASAATDPDANLIELGRRYSTLHADYVATSKLASSAYAAAKTDPSQHGEYLAILEREGPLFQQVSDLEEAILKSPVATLEGLRVKALVAHNSREPEDHEMSYGEQAAFAVVDFVLGRSAEPAQAPVHAVAEVVLPVLPRFSLDGLQGRHLDILFDLFLAIENVAMGIVNQPRCDQGGTKEVLLNDAGEIVDRVQEWATAARDMIGKYADTSEALDPIDAENRRWVALKNLAHYQCTLSEIVMTAAKPLTYEGGK